MRICIVLVSYLLSISVYSAELVKVGVYDFPPYVFIAGETTGLTMELITQMNHAQDKYKFITVPTTARRRYSDFEKHKFDMMVFESKSWGWQKYPVDVSQVFVTGDEVYVTQAKPGRGQDFFTDFENKAMIGVMGYHYQFANFQADQDYLKKHFNILQTNSQQISLELILKDRGEIAVISREYLKYHFANVPTDKEKLLISDKLDQVYRHTFIIRKDTVPSVSYINKLLEQIKQQGTLKPLWKRYGLKENH